MDDFTLAFTDKKITPWGGLAVMKHLCDRIGLDFRLEQIGLPGRVQTGEATLRPN